MSLFGSIASSVGSFLGGGLGSIGQGFLNEYFTRRNQRHQNNLMIDNWNLQNAYNSPDAQMQRFREAGLNPNLIYGQTNMAGSVGSVGGSVSVDNPLSNVYTFEQMRNLRSQNDNIVQQNDNLKEQARALRIDNNLRENAGPLADAPWYWRLIYRSLPSSWKKSNGDLNFDRLSPGDVGRVLLSGLTGAMSLPNGFFNPTYNPGASGVPPVGFLISGDRGHR